MQCSFPVGSTVNRVMSSVIVGSRQSEVAGETLGIDLVDVCPGMVPIHRKRRACLLPYESAGCIDYRSFGIDPEIIFPINQGAPEPIDSQKFSC